MRRISLLLLLMSNFAYPVPHLKSSDFLPQPKTDLAGLENFIQKNGDNLPNIFGSKIIQKVSLYDEYQSHQFKAFPIQLNCNFDAGCNAQLQVGQVKKGFFEIKASDLNTNNSMEVYVKFTDYYGNPVDISKVNYTIQQDNKNEVFTSSDMVDITPYIKYGYQKTISYFDFPIIPNLSYQFCDRAGENCTDKKIIFDDNFSGDQVNYLSFWKLEFTSNLSPNTGNTKTVTFQTGLTETDMTTLSYGLGSPTLMPYQAMNVSFSYSSTHSTSFQNSKVVSYQETFDHQNTESLIGDYILYAGIFDDFSSITPFIDELNSRIKSQGEFYFSKQIQYSDANPKTENQFITAGSTAFLNGGGQIPSNGSDLDRWTVSVPSANHKKVMTIKKKEVKNV